MSKCIICGNNIKQRQLSLSLDLTIYPLACRKCLPRKHVMIMTNGKYLIITKENYNKLNKKLKFRLPFAGSTGIVQIEKSYIRSLTKIYKEYFLTEEEKEEINCLYDQMDYLADNISDLQDQIDIIPFRQIKFGGI